MSVFRYRPGAYDSKDVEFMQDLADRTALAISNAIFHLQTRNALRLRDDFILLASHELRTPLTALSLQLKYLEKKYRDGRASADAGVMSRIVSRASESVSKLSTLVQDILEMADLASGEIDLIREPTDLAGLVTDLVKLRCPNLGALDCQWRLETMQPAVGEWDHTRIEELVGELLDLCAASGRSRLVRVSVLQKGDRARLELRVGTVLGESRLQHLAGPERRVSIERLGLGIYVANEVIEAHGGWFRFYGNLGKEFAFIIELPLAAGRNARFELQKVGA
jgi:signal transduction histidine kinase